MPNITLKRTIDCRVERVIDHNHTRQSITA